MAKKSAIYLFERDERSPNALGRATSAATDAVSVVHRWAMGEGRSAQVLLDQNDVCIAYLAYDDEREQEASDDLETLCSNAVLKRSAITQQEADNLRR